MLSPESCTGSSLRDPAQALEILVPVSCNGPTSDRPTAPDPSALEEPSIPVATAGRRLQHYRPNHDRIPALKLAKTFRLPPQPHITQPKADTSHRCPRSLPMAQERALPQPISHRARIYPAEPHWASLTRSSYPYRRQAAVEPTTEPTYSVPDPTDTSTHPDGCSLQYTQTRGVHS